LEPISRNAESTLLPSRDVERQGDGEPGFFPVSGLVATTGA
jgi:hypothetical protein